MTMMQGSSKQPLWMWAKVGASSLLFVNTWGILLSFGAFEQYYATTLLRGTSPSTLSWIGTIDGFLLLTTGVISGPLFDRGWFRALTALGSLLFLLGLFLLSICTRYWQVFVTQALIIGLGAGLLYVPSVASITRDFGRRRSLALGVALSGASIGGVIYSVMLEQLLPRLGFGWTVRCIGFVCLFNFAVAASILMRDPPPRLPQKRALIDSSAVRDGPFMLFAVGGFFVILGYYLPFLFVPTQAASLGASSGMQLNTVAVINGASFFGRIAPAWLADRMGPVRTIVAVQASAAVLLFCWLAVSSTAGLLVWSAVWGFVSGLLIVLAGAALPFFSPSPRVIGARLGMAWAISALGFLIGGPIGGAIVGGGSLAGMQAFSGAALALGATSCGSGALWRRRQLLQERGEGTTTVGPEMAGTATREGQAAIPGIGLDPKTPELH